MPGNTGSGGGVVRAGGVASLGWGWQPPDVRAPGGAPAGQNYLRGDLRRRQGSGGGGTTETGSVPRELCVVCGVWVDLAQKG